MPPIYLRFCFSEMAELAALPLRSRARRRAFAKLRRELIRGYESELPRPRLWQRLQNWAQVAAALLFLASLACMLLKKALLLWPWMIAMAASVLLLLLSKLMCLRAGAEWVNAGIGRIEPRLCALSPQDLEELDLLLQSSPDYMRAPQLQSNAVCGCIRCGERFIARRIPRSKPLHRPLCPCCGAGADYLVYSDGDAEATEAAVRRLHELFS